MIKVGLVTNWQEACAVAEYANSLVMHASSDEVQYKIIHPSLYERVLAEARDVDVLHLNYAYWVFKHFDRSQWMGFKPRTGKPVVLTLHESNLEVIRAFGDLGPAVDTMVVHEKPTDGKPYLPGFRHIPQPIRMVDGLSPAKPKQKIGMVGFPFIWKNYRSAAHLAWKLDLGFMALLGKPKSDKIDLESIAAEILELHPGAEIEMGWLPYDYMVRRLRECMATIYPYDEDAHLFGVSAGVRMGMAARRPIIVSSHHQQFKDLLDYPNEVYVMNSQNVDSMERALIDVVSDTSNDKAKVPNKLLQDMNWSTCAAQYVNVYKQLVNLKEEEKVCA